ncbi:MAG: M48 family metallopeptidase [Treponema sp.]|nr:M48 family metallopeptidase [Treponema sp.]
MNDYFIQNTDLKVQIAQGFYKNPRLTIHPKSGESVPEIHLELPYHLTEEDGILYIQNSLDELQNQVKYLNLLRFHNPPVFERGEGLYFLGYYYKLEVICSSHAKKPYAMVNESTIFLFISESETLDSETKMRLIEDCFMDDLASLINETINIYSENLNVESKTFSIRPVDNAYACCDNKGHLTFSPLLLHKHQDAIKTVVLHELCHLVEFNHSDKFFSLMDSNMPEWKKYDALLKEVFPPIEIKQKNINIKEAN